MALSSRDHLIVALIVQLFLAKRVFADNLTAVLLVLIDDLEVESLLTKLALDVERGNDFLDYTGSVSDANVLLAHGAVLV